MRWKKNWWHIRWGMGGEKTVVSLKVDDRRIITKFLYFPKCLGDEYRWWEYADINQKVCFVLYYNYDYDSHWVDGPKLAWMDKYWSNK